MLAVRLADASARVTFQGLHLSSHAPSGRRCVSTNRTSSPFSAIPKISDQVLTARIGRSDSREYSTTPAPTPKASPAPVLSEADFDNTELLYRSRSTSSLLFNYAILRLCTVPWFVKAAPTLFTASQKVPLLEPLVLAAMKHTFFRQFCSGESIEGSKPALQPLAASGIGSILDYAVETVTNEAGLDEVVRQVVDSIRLAASEPAIKFSCVKVSGLCSETLMEKAAAVLRLHPDLLDRFEADWRATDVAAVLGGKGGDHLRSEDVLQLAATLERLGSIGAAAAASNLPVLIDAEQTWVQPWIDLCSMLMSLRHNHTRPVVYNTYQLYLKDGLSRLRADLARAQRCNIMLGAKLVRGAYMVSEAARAEEQRYENPILPSINDTHQSYNSAVQLLIKNIERAALMVASHNKDSLILASRAMNEQQLPALHPRIHFAQLYGMADHLTYALAGKGYQACKYVPFGPAKYVIPYLVRRIHENSSMLGRAGEERQLLSRELLRRQSKK